MTREDVPDEPLSREELHDRAVRFLLAMLRSASTDDIDPKEWWRRAQAALEWGAKTATTYHELRAAVADSLEIDAPTKTTSRETSSIYSDLREHDQFERFRRICEQQAFAVTSDAQVERDRRSGEYEQKDPDETEFADPFGLKSEMDLPTTEEE